MVLLKVFLPFKDFIDYYIDIYQSIAEEYMEPHHIKIIECGIKYWLCANIWNNILEEFFTILKWENECEIEEKALQIGLE